MIMLEDERMTGLNHDRDIGDPAENDQLRELTTSAEQQEIMRLQDQIKRLLAEFDNYRKRSQREWQTNRDRAASDIFKILLPTLDSLEKALAPAVPGAEEDSSLKAYKQGIQLIYDQLLAAVQQEGLVRLEVIDREFDPEHAEAIGLVPAEEDNKVKVVVQSGWKFRNEILRPAKVLVGQREVSD